MKEAFAIVLTIARDDAFFSLVWPQVAETQPRIILLTQYVPIVALVRIRLWDTKGAGLTDGEDNHGEVLCAHVQRRETKDKTKDGDSFGHSDMPCALVEATRRITVGDRTESGNEVRRAGKGESDLCVEFEGFDDGGEEVLESVCSKMHVLHESEEPELRVRCRCLETGEWAHNALFADGVEKNAVVCQDALFRCEPLGVERIVWKDKACDNRYNEGCDTLNDEKPLPAGEIDCAVELEDSNGNETGECSSEDVSGVQD